ncbi:MAG: TonB-dependent receptor [Bryobacteraceae bacterium]|nr:TonB-dependent receptor [Bryobacteraceae bacterium]
MTPVILLAAVLLLLPAAWAQDARGTVLGRVMDSTGAMIPGAEIRITNEATGVVATARTNDAGSFILPYLIPGTYQLSCEMQGFKRYIFSGIQVRINDSVEVIVTLEVGATSETIEVTDTTPLLSTVEASLGQVIDERRVLELPLFAGNAMDLVHLAPGTVNGTNLRLRKAPFNAAPSQFSTDGSGNNQNEFSIDGVSNTFSAGTAPRVAFSPPQTAISEFKVQTSQFDASLGRTIGSTVNVSTKSGTNEIHGEMHHWVRNRVFDAPTIFQNRSGQRLAVYQDNRYGASAGAPIIIPGVYNGKNKSFWFFAFEGNKFGDPQVGQATSTVPTAKMRTGDLSEWRALGANYQIYDPFSTVTAPNGRFQRTPVPNNIIPASQINPVARNIMNFYPMPNQDLGDREFRNNYFFSGKAIEDYWVWITRLDHAFSENHRMFVRLHRDFWEEDKNRWFNDEFQGIILNRNNKGIALDDVYVINPTFLFNFRYGLTYQDFPERRVSRGFDLASLGFSQNLVNLVPEKSLMTFPRVTLTPFRQLGQWESGDGVTASMTHSFVATFTKIKGNHNMRFGPEYRIYRENANRFPQMVAPDLSFNSTFTRGPLDTAPNPQLGGDVAAFFYGIPAGSMARIASYAEQDTYTALFFHDDWKITPTFTLNLGVRYELETPITERFNRAVTGYDVSQLSPVHAQALANYTAQTNRPAEVPPSAFEARGGLMFAAPGGNKQRFWQGERNNFMPRIGFAWAVRPKTVIRGGYGWFFNSIGTNMANTIQTGFSQSTPVQASLDNGLTFPGQLHNPFPTGLLEPLGAAGGLGTNLGQGISYYRDRRLQPYAQRWSFGFQQELPFKVMMEHSYVGNRGTRLSINRPVNEMPVEFLSRSPERDQATINYLGQNFPSPFRGTNPIYGANMSRAGLLRPFPHFGGITLVGDHAGYSWYHSLQSRFERRLAQGWTAQASYTWSKAMEATEFINSADPMPYEVVSGLDRPHRLTASGIWEIPVGRGRTFLGNLNSVGNFVLGGWQYNVVYMRQSGAPMGFGNAIFNGDLDNIVLPKGQRSVDGWFNRDAGFNRNAAQQLGSNWRQFPLRFSGVRGPIQDRWDMSMLKNFRINERWRAQFRAESFNAMNHPNLANPNTTVTAANFGIITGQDSPRSWQLALKIEF